MKAVILAGGLGTRISEETSVRPKPMVEIGGKPILWHIMKIYAAHGINDFVVCLGYKGYVIKEYFANYLPAHVRRHLRPRANSRWRSTSSDAEPWRVTLVDTGEDTMTGGRLQARAADIGDERARSASPTATASPTSTSARCSRSTGRTAAGHGHRRPAAGPLRRAATSTATGVEAFKEKPQRRRRWINGGFFVLEPEVLDLHRRRRRRLGARAAASALAARRPAARLSATTASGSRWTRCATSTSSRSCGQSGKAPWKTW